MELIQICSNLINDTVFSFAIDVSGTKVTDKTVLIKGKNSYKKETGLELPFALCDIEKSVWEEILKQYKHSPEIKEGYIYAYDLKGGKTIENVIANKLSTKNEFNTSYGNEKIKLKNEKTEAN